MCRTRFLRVANENPQMSHRKGTGGLVVVVEAGGSAGGGSMAEVEQQEVEVDELACCS